MRAVLCPVLVGRETQARLLLAALHSAQAGRGGTVLLAGEAGIGKSRLAREIAAAARERGFVALTGRAVSGGVRTPFRPFAEALTAGVRHAGVPPDATALDPFRPALARLVPQLRSGDTATADTSLVFMGEAVIQLLRVLPGAPHSGHLPDTPGGGRCLLVLEDLHWSDLETLSLLEYLADNLSAEPVLCVGTFRADEGSDAADLAAKLESRGYAEVLLLDRLDQESTGDMALACLGALELPAEAQTFIAEHADGVPFLVEELLAGLLENGALVARGAEWRTAGPLAASVPATFADAVGRRLASVDADARRVIHGAAVLGRGFDWPLLGRITGLPDEVVLGALRQGVDLQLLEANEASFRFRHALTQEAVLASLLPSELAALAGHALYAVRAAHPGLPGAWCTLAAGLAERAGDPAQARELLIEAGRRDLTVGALASAEDALIRARELVEAGAGASAVEVDEALTEVFAMSGQVDKAIETARRLLARIGTPSPAGRLAELHLRIARAAIAGGRWADAEASLEIARRAPDADAARLDVCAANVAEGRGHTEEAERLARAALRSAERGGPPEVACEALEVIGRVARQRDLDEAERAFSLAEAIAAEHDLPHWRVRALYELGTNEMVRTEGVERLVQARDAAVAQGALSLTATIDLLLAVGLNKQFRADEALDAARRSAAAARRFRLVSLPMALIMEANAHAIRREPEEMEARIAEAMALAPADRDVVGGVWGYCRATLALLDENREQAWLQMSKGAEALLNGPAAFAPPFLGLWPLLAAVLGYDAASAAARVAAVHGSRRRVVAGLLRYAEAVMAGKAGDRAAADAAFSAGDAQLGPLVAWYRHYGRRIAAEAALTDGWGAPVAWLREAAPYFEARGDDKIAMACRGLLREAGVPVPRLRAGDPVVPERLRALGVTGREADVLRLVAQGLANREIARELVLSPRTVEKHVASLLVKTGLHRRTQLAGYVTD